ncbi:DUF2254 family protein [Streptomyces bobili]|uniref:DUF2254 family protein n=1 Tax=Streptomyces bobili TaxID=67280 RepID=UPI0034431303
MTGSVRARPAFRSRGTYRARRNRSHAIAVILVAAGALLGWTLPRWERHLPEAGLTFDASTAQATLAAIAGGMITLAGFVVTAITLVVQTVQTMSPRLVAALGHFSRYLVLFGLLIGTALFALVALSQVRDDDVPRVTVTLAVGLVLVDAVTVLSLLASLRHAVTGGGLARAVGERLRTVVDQTHPAAAQAVSGPPPPPPAPAPSGEGEAIRHRGHPALIVALDEPRLVRLAARHDIQVRFLHTVGDFVGSGTTVAYLTPPPGRDPDDARQRRLARRVAACVRFGPGRSIEQDTAYGLRLLADIAIRALSPAVNDPTTAIEALDQIEDVLRRLADRAHGPYWLVDEAGRPRVSCPAPYWPDLVSLALDETLLYGSANPQTVRRLHALLDHLLAATADDRGAPLAERREALHRLAATALPDPLLNAVAAQPDPQGLGGIREPP